MTTRWGRIGTAGQSKTKPFADTAAAAKQVAKLIEEKTEEGYVEK
jgi:predicted DNA-binding WGR domain protein